MTQAFWRIILPLSLPALAVTALLMFLTAWNEWVIVLKGSATLQFEQEPAARSLGVGDYVFIPARKRHRVEWTEPQQPTVWLAVHFE